MRGRQEREPRNRLYFDEIVALFSIYKTNVKFTGKTSDSELIFFRLMSLKLVENTATFLSVTEKGLKYIEMVETTPLPKPVDVPHWRDPREV